MEFIDIQSLDHAPIVVGQWIGPEDSLCVVRKLGTGSSATVWLVQSRSAERYALKVFKAADDGAEGFDAFFAAEEEIEAFDKIRRWSPEAALRCAGCVGNFVIESRLGKHPCLLMEEVGEDLEVLASSVPGNKLPLAAVRHIARGVLHTLALLHKDRIIHADLKPCNMALAAPLAKRDGGMVEVVASRSRVLTKGVVKPTKGQRRRVNRRLKESGLRRRSDQNVGAMCLSFGQLGWNKETSQTARLDVEEVKSTGVKLVDFGLAHHLDDETVEVIQTPPYRSFEVFIGAGHGTSADIWSLAVSLVQLATGKDVFLPAGAKHVGDIVASMVAVLGPPPIEVLVKGRHSLKYFNRDGTVKGEGASNCGTVEDFLAINGGLSVQEVREFADFLRPMLAYDPWKRAPAEAMMSHPWLHLRD